MMMRVKVVGDLLGIGEFIRGFVEAHGECVDLRNPKFVHFLYDRGGIQASRKVHSHGDITDQLSLDCLFD